VVSSPGFAVGRFAALLVLGAVATSAGAAPPSQPAIDFNRQVRPILSENCFACHGPDARTRKARLRLDSPEGAFGKGRSGRPTIVAGRSAASELIARVGAEDESERMPPIKSGKKLTKQQIEVLRQWIDQGAKWSEHWAFVPPQQPKVPAVKDTTWPRNPLDLFVLARLEREGLKPSPQADRRTLLRRVSLDLTGLPPTPAEVSAFLLDRSPDAWEKAVDRLLASPRFGERLAMQWLDGARYADSNGYQADFERYMWRWRDWVIDSFNHNKPFDRFTVEQIAGDLLPGATLEQKIATGFNRNHRINTEGGIIGEEWRVEYVADRVETMGSVWMGLTLNCCRCHDHKYDPIKQKDFYQLFAFFNNVPESGAGAEQPVNHPPIIPAPRAFEQKRLAEMDEAIARAEAALQSEWEKMVAGQKTGVVWTTLAPAQVTSEGKATLTVQPDRIIVASGNNPAMEEYTIVAPISTKNVTGLRLEALPDDRHAGNGPGRSVNGNFVLTNVRVEANSKLIALDKASASFSQAGYPVSSAIGKSPGSGWAIHPKMGMAHSAVFSFAKPLALKDNEKLTIRLAFRSPFGQHQFGRFRLSVTDTLTPHAPEGIPTSIRAIVAIAPQKRTPAQNRELASYFRVHRGNSQTEADRKLQALRKARQDYASRLPTVMVMAETQPRDAYVLIRGQYDRRGEKVSAGLPAVLPPLPSGSPANRLGLANWLVSPTHPLTARVAVNRFWEQLFGVGLVKSSENFGSQGEPPSHSELLDWLAVEFRDSGWDTKAILKKIVTSATYRQSSHLTAGLREKDPENRLLARGARFRLPAETVRDNALAISGLLVERTGGPSVRPYQPKGVWNETSFYGNLRNYQHDKGEGLYRRSLYTIRKRTAGPPTMLLFDSPSREVCTVKRSRTNTPLQALALLNEVTFLEAARVLAERMLREGGKTAEDRIRHAFLLAISREPSASELRLLSTGLSARMARYRANPEAAKKLLQVGESRPDPKLDVAALAAYTMTASVILNLDETITRE
jgi:mono/diheme cytochrome c family protein